MNMDKIDEIINKTEILSEDYAAMIDEIKRLREEKRFVELEHGIGLDNREAQVTIRLNQHYEKQHEKLLAEVKKLRDVLRDVKSDIDSYLNGGWNGDEGWEAISSIISALGIQTDMDLMMEESE
jgi:hypothetical protein